MNRYSPIWSQIIDSSLWCEEDYVVKIFLTMIAKKDLDDIVRGTAFNIGQWSKKTEEETLKALKILSSPDRKRIEKQEYEGRRIEKVSEGWLVLNGAHYRKMMFLATRREYKRLKQREYRIRDQSTKEIDPKQKAYRDKTMELGRKLKKIHPLKAPELGKGGNPTQAEAEEMFDEHRAATMPE